MFRYPSETAPEDGECCVVAPLDKVDRLAHMHFGWAVHVKGNDKWRLASHLTGLWRAIGGWTWAGRTCKGKCGTGLFSENRIWWSHLVNDRSKLIWLIYNKFRLINPKNLKTLNNFYLAWKKHMLLFCVFHIPFLVFLIFRFWLGLTFLISKSFLLKSVENFTKV